VNDDGTVAHVATDLGEFAVSTANLDSAPEDIVGTNLSFSVRSQPLALSADRDNAVECWVEDIITHASKGTQVLLTPQADESKEIQLQSRQLITDLDEEVAVGWQAADATILERTSVIENVDLKKDILGT